MRHIDTLRQAGVYSSYVDNNDRSTTWGNVSCIKSAISPKQRQNLLQCAVKLVECPDLSERAHRLTKEEVALVHTLVAEVRSSDIPTCYPIPFMSA